MIRRRKRPEPTPVNRDRWLVSYADFITLLFGFFVVMYSVSQVNESKYRELSETLGATFKSRGAIQTPPSDTHLGDIAELKDRVQGALAEPIEAGEVTIRATDEWVEISVDANVLFESGSAKTNAEARDIFAQVAALLTPYENAIDVAGHTDNQPIRNNQFQNNWELSAARATSVVSLLSEAGIAPQRLSATGYGEFHPVADNSTEEGRAENRRVVLLVQRHKAERRSLAAETMANELRLDEPTDNENAPGADSISESNTLQREGARSDTGEQEGSTPAPQEPLKPVILEDGSLLFSSDPELPRRR